MSIIVYLSKALLAVLYCAADVPEGPRIRNQAMNLGVISFSATKECASIEFDTHVPMASKSNYFFVEEKGQRIFGPPVWWSGPPPKDSEIFIGKLPIDMNEDELLPVLESVAPLYELRLMMVFSNNTRGFAFARYTSPEDARKAISILDDFEIRPRHKIGVLKSRDNNKVFIQGLPAETTQEEVFRELSQYTEGVVKVTLPKTAAHNKVKSEVSALVEYETHRAACNARRVLLSGEGRPFGRYLSLVDWKALKPEAPEQFGKENSVLYVRNIPINISENRLQCLFSLNNSLPIHNVRKIKNFAFVHYDSRKDAENALNKLNGIDVCGFIIEITWAKPPYIQRTVRYLKGRKQDTRFEQQYQTDSSSKHSPLSWCTNPIQLLEVICLASGSGEPMYKITYSISSSTDNRIQFTAQVFTPNSPLPLNSSIPPGKGFSSPQDAKLYAALCVLRSIGYDHNNGPDLHTSMMPLPSPISPPKVMPLPSPISPPNVMPLPSPISPPNMLPECSLFNILDERDDKFYEPTVIPNTSQNGAANFGETYTAFMARARGDSANQLQLMAAAAAVANLELQASCKNQNIL